MAINTNSITETLEFIHQTTFDGKVDENGAELQPVTWQIMTFNHEVYGQIIRIKHVQDAEYELAFPAEMFADIVNMMAERGMIKSQVKTHAPSQPKLPVIKSGSTSPQTLNVPKLNKPNPLNAVSPQKSKKIQQHQEIYDENAEVEDVESFAPVQIQVNEQDEQTVKQWAEQAQKKKAELSKKSQQKSIKSKHEMDPNYIPQSKTQRGQVMSQSTINSAKANGKL